MPDSAPIACNFGFLRQHDALLAALTSAAERYCIADPGACLLKLRQFGEAIAQHVAAVHGWAVGPDARQADLLADLCRRQVLDEDVLSMLHLLRVQGNVGVHQVEVSPRQAGDALRIARQLAIWFHRAFRSPGPGFKPGPFVAPTSLQYRDAARRQTAEMEQLRDDLARARTDAQAERELRTAAEQAAELQARERAVWEQLAQAEEAERLRLQAEFNAQLRAMRENLRAADATASTDRAAALARQAAERATQQAIIAATRAIDLDEADTRALIDRQLRDAGWEADTQALRYGKGTRPQRDRCIAIVEWPTLSGPADYVLFCGMRAVGVVEAKRFSTDIPGSIGQAERYSLGMVFDGEAQPATPPDGSADQAARFAGWPALAATVIGATHYRVPFVFATNGRAWHRQFETRSGVWFRDVRRSINPAFALPAWHTPQGLMRLLAIDAEAAERQLQDEPFGYLDLRDYQVRAVQAVESAIAQGQRQALVAMATGTGKTRTVIGLIYRLLKAQRFQRVLFLVDRSSLGEQAQNAFHDARLEQNRRFTEIYELKQLADVTPDPATKVHVATVQGMVRRLFSADTDDQGGLPVDRYDCIVVDEAHRGYILDREMGEGELLFRDEGDYISAYRRVLDQFDAVKVALTATPAQHTVQIFGHPVFTYTYHEAVVDGWLIDHLPPVRLRTMLAANGIHFDSGETVTVVNTLGTTGERVLPDELDYEVDHFNRLVLAPNFNRVVCDELARHIDPMGPTKTLVFCANDSHADLVVQLLNEALAREHGPLHARTVLKITGRADKPDALIRLFKNETLPNIAVTVDLLTTGVDVPRIGNLVFLRRVRSRILYEQMLGRATRLCPEIGKEHFRIFDAVDLYAALDAVNTMRPVVQQANIPLAQLMQELADPAAAGKVVGHDASTGADITHADQVRDELLVRIRNLLRRAQRLSDQRPPLKHALDHLQLLTGLAPQALAEHLKRVPLDQLQRFMAEHGSALSGLQTDVQPSAGVDMVLAPHADELLPLEAGYGAHSRPEDYLGAFAAFIRDNANRIAALRIVLTRPRDLTSDHLRTLLVELARHQFTEPVLRSAYARAGQADVAATVIGYIRQQALGSPLLPFSERVDRAVARIGARQAWTPAQRKWLERIATTLKDKVAVDETTFNQGAYANAGGFRTLDQVFGGQGRAVLGDLEDEVWNDAA